VEVPQLEVHVQGDAVIGDATLDAQAQRPDLPERPIRAAVDPAAGVAVASNRLDTEPGARLDHGRLEGRDQRADEQAAIAEAEDRGSDQLAGPVGRHLAAALDPDDLDAASGKLPWRGEDMARIRLPAEGQHGIVLEEQEPVADLARRTLPDELLLELPGLPVPDPT